MAVQLSFKTLLSDRRGGVAVMGAIAVPLLLMMGGAAVDVHRASNERVRLQNALDAAVLSGIAADVDGDTDAAERTFNGNKPAAATGSFAVVDEMMTGTGSSSVTTSFLILIGVRTLPVSATAKAAIGLDQPACLLLLEPTAVGLTLGSNVELNAEGCPVRVNSSHATGSATAGSNSTINSHSFCTKGGVTKGSGTQFTPAPRTNCAPLPNPLASLPEPVIPGPCPDVTVPSNSTRSIAPGCYNNISASSNSTLTFEPGVFRITGHANLNSNSSTVADQVTLFFSGPSARLTVSSNNNLTLKAPDTGPTAGVAIFQNHDAANSTTESFALNSNVSVTLEGLVYIPNSHFLINSNVDSGVAWNMVIAKTMAIDSNSTVSLYSDFTQGPPLPALLRPVRLDE